ncbi:MAG: hypothetical protein JST30_14520 [Armatimonadetes bacterium]|nr:hypothetical protein [Armatimonadota bacterium]
MEGDRLSEEQSALLRQALEHDRLATVNQLIRAVSKHLVDPDTDVRTRTSMRMAGGEGVWGVFQRKQAAAKAVGRLGDAMISRRVTIEDIVANVCELVQEDSSARDAVERVSLDVLGLA